MIQSAPGNGETLLFPCAGAAHCGRVAYEAAVRLTGEGPGQIFCLAAVAAGIEEKIERTRSARRRVAIDGCDDACARKTLEQAGMQVDEHLLLSSLGVEKKPARPGVARDARRVVNLIREQVSRR